MQAAPSAAGVRDYSHGFRCGHEDASNRDPVLVSLAAIMRGEHNASFRNGYYAGVLSVHDERWPEIILRYYDD